MIEFRFGRVVTADIFDFRAMLVCPAVDAKKREMPNWWAVVLIDHDERVSTRWATGQFITLSPSDRGIRMVDE